MKKGFSRERLKYKVNERFFDKWSSQMAYILGFTYADGNIYKTSLAWDLQTKDLKLLVKIRKAMGSNYPIIKRSESVRLRMSNRNLNISIAGKGLIEKKAKRVELPKIPQEYISHFIRGFLDGDGWIVKRNKRNEVDLGFVSGNRNFLESLSKVINKEIGISGRVREKNKITSNGFKSTTYLMEYYSSKAVRVADWLYGGLTPNEIYLDRKYKKYLAAKELSNFLASGTKKVRVIQKNLGEPLKVTHRNMYINKHLDGVQIAKTLGVHSSSVYRWLERFGIKYPIHRNLTYGQI
jgi:hypothetical protein